MSRTSGNRPGGIGDAIPRSEDLRLLRGLGRYVSDFAPPGLCYCALVRAPHASASIESVDASQALARPGVLTVLTGADAVADGLRPIPHDPDWRGPPDAELRLPDGFDVTLTEHSVLAIAEVSHVGEAVALVVAETEALAADAAELVEVSYQPRRAVVDAREAMGEGAPRVWASCPDNLALTCEVGDAEACEEAFARAAHVVELDAWIHRVNGVPMEPRAAIGEFDAATGRYRLRAASGRGAVQTRERLAKVLGVGPEQCHVVFGDMGGNFGTRNAFSPEFALVAWAAKRVGRPVKWTASRTECFATDYQARDLRSHAELALDADGNFLALRGENTLNLGAHTVYFWPLRKGLSMMQAVYRIPAVYFRGHAVLTHTTPTAVYRSAGRPEAVYMMERLIDRAAARHGFDRVELRRRNLVRRDDFPFINGVGVTYDSGDYAAAMDEALLRADWAGFAARRADSATRGLCRGRSVANYIEVTSGIPRERAELHVDPAGIVELVVGTMSSGQGHETSFAQLASEWLQLPFACIRFVANDTERVSVGGGSHSGRSMRLVSIALDAAVRELLEKSKAIAAFILQAPVERIDYAEGQFVASSGGQIHLFELAREALQNADLPRELRGRLQGVGDITNRVGGYPYGTHVCEVEVDPETGLVAVVAWTGVDDVGRAINPLILHGQAQGAAAQGIGQALCEAVVYDGDSGQLLSGSFMDYALPRADDLPDIHTVISEVPASSHPHGIRPGGEGGTTPALAAVVNAVVDALREFGVEHVEMPLTPQRVLRAIRKSAELT